MDFEGVKRAIEKANSAAIFTHTNMDGDAVGSSRALCLLLRKLGKRCSVILEDAFPERYAFMKGEDMFIGLEDYEGGRDLAIAVDLGELPRLEGRKEAFLTSPVHAFIDHHIEKESYEGLRIVNSETAAASQLVLELIEYIDPALMDRDIAEALYVGITTDTGTFRYVNADKSSLLAAARLYDYGIRHSEICTTIYENYPEAQLKLESLALERAKIFAGGRAVISYCTLDDLERFGATHEMTDTCIDRIRIIEGVEIACFIKERRKGYLKIRLRSKYDMQVTDIAIDFGGGGHPKAAGCTMNCGIEEAIEKMSEAMEKKLAREPVGKPL